MYTMTPMYHMFKDRHIKKFKKVMTPEVHQIDQHLQEVVLDALRSA
jgi:hypothetical protein